MKKTVLALLVLCVMTMSALTVQAEDLAVQFLPVPQTETESSSLDDMQLGASYTIDGYAIIEPKDFMVADCFAQFNKDANYHNVSGSSYDYNGKVFTDNPRNDWYANWRWWEAAWKDSGTNADFLFFVVDVTNLQKKSKAYMEEATVKVFYQDEYEFGGWVRQINYDYINYGAPRSVCRTNYSEPIPNYVVMDPENEEAIDMMYTGTYVFGATIPNKVIEDKKSPLRIQILLGGNELTYYVRK